ncbi:hypothetical protein HIM_05985 [Hirsutella minnesotensis 3608]|uniref:Sulfotransferase domain-containing protein n=1 Tax=Hirsutella minnesotensis 3608 TaxID=1043627 RepID=A0A0F7ZP00_9HYPO|nr:hypothetical protein HIM_05985 [Hirsutella minnesotensis 3608]
MEEINLSTSRRIGRRDVFLFSHPRTASNLVTHLLSQQPGWAQSEYHFRRAFHYARRALYGSEHRQLTCEQRQEFEDLFQRGFSRLCQVRDAASKQGKCLFVKNHAFLLWDPCKLQDGGTASPAGTNPTRLPDDFLASWQPVFLIRHPALVFESWYRAEMRVESIDIRDSALDCFLTFRYSRRLYDWFVSRAVAPKDQETRTPDSASVYPIVLDANEIIETDSAIPKLCELLNMDPLKVCYSWKPTRPPGDVGLSLLHVSYMGGFWASDSIDKTKSSTGLNIGVKEAQWKEEFGAVVADALLTQVNNAMPDYNYLRDKRI